MNKAGYILLTGIILLFCFAAGCTTQQKAPPPESIPGPSIIDLEDIAATSSGITLNDAIGREVTVPRNITNILCLGPGSMRYLSWLGATGKACGVDQNELTIHGSAVPAYLLANPRIFNLPALRKNSLSAYPSMIRSFSPKPDLIIRTGESEEMPADELQMQTGIPVLVIREGDLAYGRNDMNFALRLMGVVLGKSNRAEDVIRFFDKVVENLQTRTATIAEYQMKSGYLGAYADGEPRSLLSTDPEYLPFQLVRVRNSAEDYAGQKGILGPVAIPHEVFTRMKPDIIALDLTTRSLEDNAMNELETDDDYRQMAAVRNGEVYGLLPTALYGEEHDADLINAYVIGKALYPDKFIDVDPEVMADYIYGFLYGTPLYEQMNRELGGITLSRIPLFT
ncbi:MAG TPA: ABC transporter substrate-binding protein [Methanospirillum sp.]|nr:ABC transporter substrate-binding protein [Methanospirillum sp.]